MTGMGRVAETTVQKPLGDSGGGSVETGKDMGDFPSSHRIKPRPREMKCNGRSWGEAGAGAQASQTPPIPGCLLS